MADFGEYTPLDAVATNSPDPYQFHNQLPVLWASTVRYILVIKILMLSYLLYISFHLERLLKKAGL
jgi:hypothetical protein